uniref:hypothetical protein n=1 Tax=Flavobacterium sp. TaxID=239 RepID=UPI00404B6D4C
MDFLYQVVQKTTAHRASREALVATVLEMPNPLANLLKIAANFSDKNHHKAAWAIEIIAESKPDLFQDLQPDFCAILPKIQDEQTLRPFAKSLFLLTKSQIVKFSTAQKQTIIETCFDWLIQDRKVAAKVYAMRTLFMLGTQTEHPEIHPTLKSIISQDASYHSAAYKAATKDILKKLVKIASTNH